MAESPIDDEFIHGTEPADNEPTHELTDRDLQRIWIRAEVIARDTEDNAHEDALEILRTIHDRLGMGVAAFINARAKSNLLVDEGDHDDRLRRSLLGDDLVDSIDEHIDGRTERNELTDEDLHDFAEALTDELDGDWATYPPEDNTARPEARIGHTRERTTDSDDHVRVIIRGTDTATFLVTAFVGTLDDGEVEREQTIAHIECEDVPEVDLTARDAVRDFVQMLADHVEEGVYFDDE